MATAAFCKINPKLILIKLHFMFMFGGLGGSLPFIVLLGKNLNINATAIGICFTTIMCLFLITSPIIGSLVDYFQNIKWFMIGLVVVTAMTGISLLFVPPINRGLHESEKQELYISYLTNNSMAFISHNDSDCPESLEMNCSFASKARNLSGSVSISGYQWEIANTKRMKEFTISDASNFSTRNGTPEIEMDSTVNSNMISVYNSYQFWIYAFLVILGGVSYTNAIALSDVACYEILDSRRELYGYQRLFGAIGWATVCLFSGFLNDISSENKAKKDYSPGFYVMGTLLAVDLLVVSKMPLVKAKFSTDMSGDLKRILLSFPLVIYAVGVTAIGIITTIVMTYEFWHLQDLGASQTLMGASIVMQCSSESFVFTISPWIVKKLGSFNCLVLAFGGFIVRCGLYSAIYNPWWALPIDTMHGLTFALFHFSMTNFASVSSPAGMEGTVLGILSGISNGLGAAIGNVLAGASLDRFGSRLMFRYASMFSGGCAVFFIIIPRFIKSNTNTSEKPHECETVKNKEDCV